MNYLHVGLLLFFTAIGCVTAYVAHQRNRNPLLWFFMGAGFSLMGLLILLMLPSKESSSASEKEDVKIPNIKKDAHSEAASFPDDSLYSQPSMPRVSRDSSIDWYFIDDKSNVVGPLKLSDLRKELIGQKMDNKTYIWCEEYADWTQIYQLQNGASLLDPDFL